MENTNQVIIYARVSSDDQNKNFSIPDQIDFMKEAVARRNEVLAGEYIDDGYSAKSFDRPDWRQLKRDISRLNVSKVYVLKWDRFARHVEFALTEIRILKGKGIEVNAILEPIDFNIPQSKYQLNTYLTSGEVEREQIALRTSMGINRSLREGYWPNMAPIGYDNHKINGRGSLIPNSDAKIIRYIFEEFSRQVLTQAELRIQVRRVYGKDIKESTMSDLLRRIVYAGRVHVPAFAGRPELIREAIHEPIISFELFEKVQRILKGGNKANRMPKVSQEQLPLRGYLECPSCGSKLTGSASKSRNGSYHHYYHCRKPCKTRFNVGQVHESFYSFLSDIRPPEEELRLYELVLQEELNDHKKHIRSAMATAERKLTKLEEQISQAQRRVFLNELPVSIFEAEKARIDVEIANLKESITANKRQSTLNQEWIAGSVEALANLPKWFRDGDLDLQREILGSTFPEKLIYDGKECRTTKLNGLISFLRNENEDFGWSETKKEPSQKEGSVAVPRAGVEPARPKALVFETNASTNSAT
ncbi:resolvase-like protein [Roseivirga thermotolerans]|uniref:Resolvase-like protein n=1 Tax=Roseivirga thermotolerans TaxID=1758176 RepID=A0ABQ3I537_9BACT|nr:resolvase-like protein [Roseivirga thermotolerans]